MKSPSKPKTGAGDSAAREVMIDLLAYVLHTLDLQEISQERKLHRIAAAVGHDLGGFLSGRAHWQHQTKGWANRLTNLPVTQG
jgi:hypothetical protein